MVTTSVFSNETAATPLFPVPPEPLQYHVFGRHVSSEEFFEAGRLCAASLERALSTIGRSTGEFSRVLDFGCGSARVLRHFAPLFDRVDFHGADVDAKVIDWDQTNITGARFWHNQPDPPLPFDDGSFDYIWSISVFSHLPEPMALQWLEELRRILQPGGVALLTVHGPFRFNEDSERGCISPEAAEEFLRRGFTYVRTRDFEPGAYPDWYQNAFMTEAFALEMCGRYFDVLGYLPRGMMGRQDIVVVRRPSY